MSEPKHRADGPAVTEPRVQPVPRHVGSYEPEDRSHERLGALAFTIEDAYRITRVHPAMLGRTL